MPIQERFVNNNNNNIILTQQINCMADNNIRAKTYYLMVYTSTSVSKHELKAGIYDVGSAKECDIHINDATVSRKHALIDIMSDGSAFIEDLRSTNGIFRNGCKLHTRLMYELCDKTQLKFGSIEATFLKNDHNVLDDEVKSPDFEYGSEALNTSGDLFDNDFDDRASRISNQSIIDSDDDVMLDKKENNLCKLEDIENIDFQCGDYKLHNQSSISIANLSPENPRMGSHFCTSTPARKPLENRSMNKRDSTIEGVERSREKSKEFSINDMLADTVIINDQSIENKSIKQQSIIQPLSNADMLSETDSEGFGGNPMKIDEQNSVINNDCRNQTTIDYNEKVSSGNETIIDNPSMIVDIDADELVDNHEEKIEPGKSIETPEKDQNNNDQSMETNDFIGTQSMLIEMVSPSSNNQAEFFALPIETEQFSAGFYEQRTQLISSYAGVNFTNKIDQGLINPTQVVSGIDNMCYERDPIEPATQLMPPGINNQFSLADNDDFIDLIDLNLQNKSIKNKKSLKPKKIQSKVKREVSITPSVDIDEKSIDLPLKREADVSTDNLSIISGQSKSNRKRGRPRKTESIKSHKKSIESITNNAGVFSDKMETKNDAKLLQNQQESIASCSKDNPPSEFTNFLKPKDPRPGRRSTNSRKSNEKEKGKNSKFSTEFSRPIWIEIDDSSDGEISETGTVSLGNRKSVRSKDSIKNLNSEENPNENQTDKKSIINIDTAMKNEKSVGRRKATKKTRSVTVKKSIKSQDSGGSEKSVKSDGSKKTKRSIKVEKLKTEPKLARKRGQHLYEAEMLNNKKAKWIEDSEPVQKPLVMLTGFDEKDNSQNIKIVKALGGTIATSFDHVQVLVAQSIKRTVKFMCCMSKGVPIVSAEWLNVSKKERYFVDPNEHILEENSNSQKSGMKMKLNIAQNYLKNHGGIMAYYQCIVFITDNTIPNFSDLSQIISSAGGQVFCITDENLKQLINDKGSKCICIADPDFSRSRIPDIFTKLNELVKSNVEILSTEFIFTLIMGQEWPNTRRFRIYW